MNVKKIWKVATRFIVGLFLERYLEDESFDAFSCCERDACTVLLMPLFDLLDLNPLIRSCRGCWVTGAVSSTIVERCATWKGTWFFYQYWGWFLTATPEKLWTRLDILTACLTLAQDQAAPGELHFRALKHLVGYLQLHPDIPQTFNRATVVKEVSAFNYELLEPDQKVVV
jgi:hypothetical protein